MTNKSLGRPKSSKTDLTRSELKIGSRYVKRGSEEHHRLLVQSRKNVRNCRQRQLENSGEFKCEYCSRFFKQRGLESHKKKCLDKDIIEQCQFCGNNFKKYGIANHQKSCQKMKK